MPEQVTRSIIVKGNVSDVYNLWANFENFPHFMQHIESVTKTGERTSHWVMRGPLGTKIEWDAETTRLEENSRIAWNSRDGGDIKTSGQVTFKELPHNETEVTVTMQYVPQQGGIAGDVAAKLFDNPEQRMEEDLYHFKQYAEDTLGTRARVIGD